jgi:hypothetical protein
MLYRAPVATLGGDAVRPERPEHAALQDGTCVASAVLPMAWNGLDAWPNSTTNERVRRQPVEAGCVGANDVELSRAA